MYRYHRFQHHICRVLIIAFLALQFQIAQAGMLSTEDLLAESEGLALNYTGLRVKQEQHVSLALMELGVDEGIAKQRVAALSDAELNSLATQLDELPAGGDILGTAVFVFLVLLVTDILGFTDIFPFVKKTVQGPKRALTP